MLRSLVGSEMCIRDRYKIVTAGEGPKPGAEDVVKVHYRGTLLDGTEFDLSLIHI